VIIVSNILNVLFDADMLAYAACAAAQEDIDWGNDIVTVHSRPSVYKAHFENDVAKITKRVKYFTKHKGEAKLIMTFSDKVNFRKTVLPSYKEARVTKRKPCGYPFLVEYVKENYETIVLPGCEGDDALSIYSELLDNTVIVSGDKDLRSVQCRLYNHLKDTYEVITEDQAFYINLYQTLNGDRGDGYFGLPGCGEVTAKKALDKSPTWETVVALYAKKGLTEEDALTQMRCARILHASDYDIENKQVILWCPKASS
jgi:DNA polymerase-1